MCDVGGTKGRATDIIHIRLWRVIVYGMGLRGVIYGRDRERHQTYQSMEGYRCGMLMGLKRE